MKVISADQQALEQQFRMARLQVFNWGTFSGLHDIPIAARGFLMVGRSGSGKSTLLDAFAALLTPPRWVDFNAAAREAERSGSDRNLVSYIRGAWADQKDDSSGEIATRYLRQGTTWSAIALSYRNAAGRVVVLVQLMWLRGRGNANSDVKRQFLIFERDFDLKEMESFGNTNLDVRKLKQAFPDTFVRKEFRPYGERFRRLLGIDSEMALRLLHKTQSAKNLGDLNSFLREFMLDRPHTFKVAERLVSEFGELNAAHQAVVTARRQVETLEPARQRHRQREELLRQRAGIDALIDSMDSYAARRRMGLLAEHITALRVQAEGLEGERSRRDKILSMHSGNLRDLERQHREAGGDLIEAWQADQHKLEQQRDERLRKQGQARAAGKQLGRDLPTTPQGFAELIGEARRELEAWQDGGSGVRDQQIALAADKGLAETEFTHTAREVQALERQPSNIPAHMLELRQALAEAIGVAVSALPFVGELVEVKADEGDWRGAIERVLHGFALSLLVDERHYAALSRVVDGRHLGQRLVYFRCGGVERGGQQLKPVDADSLVLKLNIRDYPQAAWLGSELRRRFDYRCVDSAAALRSAERGLTRQGQIKHSRSRHEKDDRRRIDDRRHWVLGFDNREKLALFRRQAQQLAQRISELQQQIETLSAQEEQQRQRAMHCQTLVNLRWQEVDVTPLLVGIDRLGRRIAKALQDNSGLQDVAAQIDRQQHTVNNADEALRATLIKLDKVADLLRDSQQQLQALQDDSSLGALSAEQQRVLDQRFEQLDEAVSLVNLDRLTRAAERGLHADGKRLDGDIATCLRFIEQRFDEFIREWPAEAEGLDATLDAAADFFHKLTRLQSDGLPAHERRFFELLENQSHQNLAALSTWLNDDRKAILERMELVNDSLNQVPFNVSADQTSYLHIDASDRQLQDVREFKQAIQQALSNAWSEDRDLAEERFLVLRGLVERLSSQEPEQKRWRQAVLDVRLHVEFIGRELDQHGVEVEVYRSGAGKSGGQRQKLATTCLAAALRYQLGGNEHGLPMYAPVVLDEAFDKADNEFTALAMNIFANFGFQMIVATPLKSVMTLEPFIGGACFVDIRDRKVSGVLLIEYDQQHQRLALSDQARREAEHEES